MKISGRWLNLAVVLLAASLVFLTCWQVGQRYQAPGLAIALGGILLTIGLLQWQGIPFGLYLEAIFFGLLNETRYQESRAAMERLRRAMRGAAPTAEDSPVQRRLGAAAAYAFACGALLIVIGLLATLGYMALHAGPFALFLAPILALPLLSAWNWVVDFNQQAAGGRADRVHHQALATSSRPPWEDEAHISQGRYDPVIERLIRTGELQAAQELGQERLRLAFVAGDDARTEMYRRYQAQLSKMLQQAE